MKHLQPGETDLKNKKKTSRLWYQVKETLKWKKKQLIRRHLYTTEIDKENEHTSVVSEKSAEVKDEKANDYSHNII